MLFCIFPGDLIIWEKNRNTDIVLIILYESSIKYIGPVVEQFCGWSHMLFDGPINGGVSEVRYEPYTPKPLSTNEF